MKEFIAVVFWLTVCLAKEDCSDWPGTIPHEAKDGSVKCCVKTTCPMGTYPEVCEGISKETTKVLCKECPEGTFMGNRTPSNNHVYQCHSKRRCDTSLGMRVKDEGSRDEDRTCECDLHSGYYDYDYREGVTVEDGPSMCHQEECPAGKELHPDGSCEKCHIGQYKPDDGYGPCIKWTDCEKIGKVRFDYGNEINDSVCGEPGAVPIVTPKIGLVRDDGDDDDGIPYEIIFGIVAGIVALVVIFGFVLYRLKKCKFPRDKDSEKQGFKGKEEIASTISSVPPYSKSPLSLDISMANKSNSKKRHGSSPDSGIADMKGYAPYFPSSEKLGSQSGPNFQYARDIQEDGASTGDEHNTSFQGETIPEETDLEDCKSVDTMESIPPVVNHHYYFPQNGNVNLQVGKDNKLYSGGAPTETPPSPDEYSYGVMDYNVPVHTAVYDPNYNTTKHTVV